MRALKSLSFFFLLSLGCSGAAEQNTESGGRAAPHPHAVDRNAYFGDLHLHTFFSFDAYLSAPIGQGVTPDQAYQFARGEPIEHLGRRIQRSWPLDFFAVTDHAEYMGVLNDLGDSESALAQSDFGRKIIQQGKRMFAQIVDIFSGLHPMSSDRSQYSGCWTGCRCTSDETGYPASVKRHPQGAWTYCQNHNEHHPLGIPHGERPDIFICSRTPMEESTMARYTETYTKEQIDGIVDKLVSFYGEGGIWPTAEQWRTLLENENDEKIFVIHFFKVREKAYYPDDPTCNISGMEALAKYGEVAQGPIERLGGQKLTHWGFNPFTAIGTDEPWDSLCVMEYPNRRAFVEVFLDPDYSRSHRHRNAGAERHRTVITTLANQD